MSADIGASGFDLSTSHLEYIVPLTLRLHVYMPNSNLESIFVYLYTYPNITGDLNQPACLYMQIAGKNYSTSVNAGQQQQQSTQEVSRVFTPDALSDIFSIWIWDLQWLCIKALARNINWTACAQDSTMYQTLPVEVNNNI